MVQKRGAHLAVVEGCGEGARGRSYPAPQEGYSHRESATLELAPKRTFG